MSQPANPQDTRLRRMLRQGLAYLRSLLLDNWGFKLLSILLALGLWTGLISQDPALTREKNFRSVPINIIGQDTLRRNGFIILDDLNAALEDVSLTANVPQGQYYSVQAGNYSVRIDLSRITAAGEQDVRILSTNSTTYGTVTEISPATVRLTVDNYVTRYRIPVMVETQGNAPDGFYAAAASCDPPVVAVSGPKSLVDRIVSVKVVSDQTTLPAREGPVRRAQDFMLVDENGARISSDLVQVTSESVLLDSIIVDQTVYSRREVDLSDVGLVAGQPAEGYEVKGVYITPGSIVIAGRATVIDDINMLYADSTVNVNGLSQSVSQSLRVRQPSILQYISTDSVTVAVEIGPVEVDRTWLNLPITLYGAGGADGVMAGVNISEAAVTIHGAKNWIDSLTPADLTVCCDLGSITGTGSYVLPLTCQVARSEGQTFTCEVQPGTVVVTMTEVDD